ncbi:MAG: arsenate reductase ArsC [Candidatus Methanoperedens sp.]
MVKYILFVCTENSARSQMAEGFFNFYNKNPGYVGISAGTQPAKSIKPYAIEVMKEKGIDLAKQKPKIITWSMAQKAYKIYTMGCIQGCPITPPEKTEDWNLEDPGERSIEKFREIRDAIEERINKLISDFH